MDASTIYHEIVDGLDGEDKGTNSQGYEQALCKCPAHNDTNPSLMVTLADKVLLKCFAGCENADVIEKLRELDLWPGTGTSNIKGPIHEHVWNEADSDDEAKDTINMYLKNRNISIDNKNVPDSLRFHHELITGKGDEREKHIGIVAKLVTPDGSFNAIQRIFLNDDFDKAEMDSPKKMLGSPNGGHVALTTDDDNTTLHVAEGIETGLAIVEKLPDARIWSALSSSNMKNLKLPSNIESLIIWADKDTPNPKGLSVGMEAAKSLGQKALLFGAEVYILLPPSELEDSQRSVDWLDDKEHITKTLNSKERFTGSPWSDAILPPSFNLDKEGLYVTKKDKKGEEFQVYLSRKPFYFAGHYVDLEAGTSKLELKYQAENNMRSIFIDRSTIYKKGWLATVANNFVLPIPIGGGDSVANYIFESDLICPRARYVTKSSGFKTLPDKTQAFPPFVGDIEIQPDGEGIPKRFKSFHNSGNEEHWLERVFETIMLNPLTSVPFIASLASPLLKVLNHDSAIIDINHTSGKGKTISCAMAMSIWGDPRGLKISWNQTKIALEQNAIAFNNLPLWFDESGANARKNDVGSSAYEIGNEVGRERGAKGGGTQATGTWKLFLISTGENSILSFAPTRWAGQDARVIPVSGAPLSGFNANQAESIRNFVYENYGFLGPRYLKTLLVADVAKLKKKAKSFLVELRQHIGEEDDLQRRKAETFSTLLVANDLLHEVLPSEYRDNILAIEKSLLDFWIDLCKAHVTVQRAYEAFEVLYNYHSENSKSFEEKDYAKRAGTIYNGQIAFLPKTWKDVLENEGFDSGNIVTEFTNRGWLVKGPGNRNKIQTSMVGKKEWFYCLHKDAHAQYEDGWPSKSDEDDDFDEQRIKQSQVIGKEYEDRHGISDGYSGHDFLDE